MHHGLFRDIRAGVRHAFLLGWKVGPCLQCEVVPDHPPRRHLHLLPLDLRLDGLFKNKDLFMFVMDQRRLSSRGHDYSLVHLDDATVTSSNEE